MAIALQVLRQTVSRALLLVVALGYGIVRPSLLTGEWVVVVVVTLMYLAAAVVSKLAQVAFLDSDPYGDPNDIRMYEAPSLVMNVLFLTWIYVALNSTITVLKEYKQSIKLKMYQNLMRAISLFVLLILCMHTFLLAKEKEVVGVSWQYAWADDVLWEVFNLLVLVTVSFICRPSAAFHLRSDREQLSQNEDDEDGGMGAPDGPGDSDGEEEEEGDWEYAAAAGNSKKGIELGGLPRPEPIDDEYGLEE